MNVFKIYLKLLPSCLPSILLNVMIFMILMLCHISAKGGLNGDTAPSLDFHTKFSLIDKDESYESKAFIQFIKDNPNITYVEISEDKIQDSLYYRKTEYALTIKSGFGEAFKNENVKGFLSGDKIDDSVQAMYIENMISQYLDNALLYFSGGFNSTDALNKSAEGFGDGIEIETFKRETGYSGVNAFVYIFFNFLPYIITSMLIQALVPTFASFMNNELKNRSLCSPIKPVSYTMGVITGAFVISLISVTFFIVVGMALFDNFFSSALPYSLLQIFIFMIFSISLAALLGTVFSNSKKSAYIAASMVSNILGLGMGFLCGVFVPQSLLDETFLNIGKLFPAFWYVRANNMLYGGDSAILNYNDLWLCIIIEALFATAIFVITTVVSRIKNNNNK